MSPEIEIQLLCKNFPGIRFENYYPVYLGIQKNKEVIAAVPGDRQQAVFHALFTIGKTKDGFPNFLGPFAHGVPNERFIYLCWGVKKEGGFEMFRRAKIHLKHLTWPVINAAIAAKQPLLATILLTDPKGGPLCASVKDSHIQWLYG